MAVGRGRGWLRRQNGDGAIITPQSLYAFIESHEDFIGDIAVDNSALGRDAELPAGFIAQHQRFYCFVDIGLSMHDDRI